MANVQNKDEFKNYEKIYLFTVCSDSGKARKGFWLTSGEKSFRRMEFYLPENEPYKIDRMMESIRFVSTEDRR